MKEQMKKTVYEAPVTERFHVELEGVFCASVDLNDPESGNGKIQGQTVNSDFTVDFTADPETNKWD